MTEGSKLRVPRSTAAVIDATVLLESEVRHDTTNDNLRLGDGSTLGGKTLVTATDAGAGLLNAVLEVPTKAALAALTAGVVDAVAMRARATAGDGGGGTFVWRTGDQSANVTIDTAGGVWVAPSSASTGASGAWQRLYDGIAHAKWFGAKFDGATDDYAAIEAGLAVDDLELPEGTCLVSNDIDMPASRTLRGQGRGRTVVKASANSIASIINVGANCRVLGLTVDGDSHTALSGVFFDAVSGCLIDDVEAKNCGYHGIAFSNAAHDIEFGTIHATNNDSRGVIMDPGCYNIDGSTIHTSGNTNAGLLIGHGSHNIQIAVYRGGGEQNASLWIHNDTHRVNIGQVDIGAPESGYEDNCAVVFGWHAKNNCIGVVRYSGWRRGVQFQGGDADSPYTDGDTAYNTVGVLYGVGDGNASSAAVYTDDDGGYYAKYNTVGETHVTNATYSFLDSSGTNYPNFFKADGSTLNSAPIRTTPGIVDRYPAIGDGGLKNRLINGSFDIDQRRVTAPADDAYVHDRWYVLTQSNPITVGTQSNPENGQANCIRLTQSNASAQRMGLAQIIESVNCIDLRALVLSLSGRLRCSSSQALRWAVLEWTGTANTVTSDVVNDWTSTTYTASNFFIASTAVVASGSLTPTADTWTALTETVGKCTSSMNNLIVFVWTSGTAAQNVTFDIGLMQLEAGGVATPFERRSNAAEIALCQRYYEKSFNVATTPAQNTNMNNVSWGGSHGAATNFTIPIIFRVTKRANVTATTYNPSATNAEARDGVTGTDCSSTTASMQATGGRIFGTTPGGSAAGNPIAVHWTADAEL